MAKKAMDRLAGVFNFVGYGNLKAPVWFIGQEEGVPDDADVARHLRVRARFAPVMDCASAHDALGIHYLHGLHGEGIKVQRTWRQMCRLMLLLEGRDATTDQLADYQARSLGAENGHTLLTELLPLPKSRLSAWPYDGLLQGRFTCSAHYRRTVWRSRKALLRDALAQSRPKLVVCYGAAEERFSELFAPDGLEPVDGTSFKAAFRPGRFVLYVPHFAPRFGRFPQTEFLNCAIGAALLAGLKLPLESQNPGQQ